MLYVVTVIGLGVAFGFGFYMTLKCDKQIEKEEEKRDELMARLSDPAFYQQGGAEIGAVQKAADLCDERILAMYARWEQLADRE